MLKFFENKSPDKKALLELGFEKNGEAFIKTYMLLDGELTLTVRIEKELSIYVCDTDFGDEYTLYRVEGAGGSYVGRVREEIKKILDSVAEKAYDRMSYKSAQTEEIIEYCKNKYGDMLEFPWQEHSSGVIRRRDTKKWYVLLMTIPASRLGINADESLSVMNLHQSEEDVRALIDMRSIFPAYHMNKKYWITVILNGSVNTEKIFELIDKSYALGKK